MWIALFRGINVGGKNRLPMKDLVRILEGLKLQNVRTYIQSGNVVFETAKKVPATLGSKISSGIEKQHGFKPQVLILSADEFEEAARANPFPKAVSDPKSLHLAFLASAPASPDLEALNALKTKSERFELIDKVFYLHAPDGIARSKLAAGVESKLGVSATSRNWRTVEKLREMLGD